MTASPIRTINPLFCLAASTAFTAPSAKTSRRPATTTANTDSFWIKRHGETVDDSLSRNDRQTPRRHGAARLGGRRSRHLVGRLLHATCRARYLSRGLPRSPPDQCKGTRAHGRNLRRPQSRRAHPEPARRRAFLRAALAA